ncbi:hypothetical protein DSO57_1008000 [Entomophthora muscae]|uniref:Uncharacterized protein n=1 Tax=Entomophthora muscae TaxID=34485 RepID=A0ACC2UHU3_9FUNG|nr:hypothetical protein DSO57_1008000 [Entomophthora muscae]
MGVAQLRLSYQSTLYTLRLPLHLPLLERLAGKLARARLPGNPDRLGSANPSNRHHGHQ